MARTNTCTNPALANNTTGWFGGGSRVTGLTGFPNRTTGYRTSGDATAPQGTVSAGQVWTYQAQVKADYTGSVSVMINTYASGSWQSSQGVKSMSVTAGTAVKVWVTATMPSGATTALLNIVDNAGSIDVTEVLYEQTGSVNGYFDGSSPSGSWTGTAGNSTSTLTASDVSLTHRASLAQAATARDTFGVFLTVVDPPAHRVAAALPARTALAIGVTLTHRAGMAQAVSPAVTVDAAAAGLPAGGELDVALWAVTGSGLLPLRHFVSLRLSPIRNSPGAIALEYPAHGENFDLLAGIVDDDVDLEVQIWLQGRSAGALAGILLEAVGDEVDEAATWTFAGAFLEWYLGEAVVFPNLVDPKLETRFGAATAGAIVGYLVGQAQSRGTLTHIGMSTFSGGLDSNGEPWSKVTTCVISPGTTYLRVLDQLVEQGMCEWTIGADHELRLFEPGGLGRDLTA